VTRGTNLSRVLQEIFCALLVSFMSFIWTEERKSKRLCWGENTCVGSRESQVAGQGSEGSFPQIGCYDSRDVDGEPTTTSPTSPEALSGLAAARGLGPSGCSP
jgi:hypothetical protein